MSKRNQIAMSAKGRRSALMLSAAAIALVSLGAGAAAAQTPPAPDTLPTGGAFVGGTGGFVSSGTPGAPVTTVNQSTDRGVINWTTFDVGQDATVNFVQPDANSLTINRVTGGGDMSQIYGTINANGTIAILNPNGVIFGGTAHVDVGGLIASTGDIDTTAFMAGGPLGFTGATAGMIDILGGADITINNAGLAAFVAPHVRNSGTITAVGGSVSLAAGETFTLDLAGDGLIELGVPTASPLVENYGSIIAQGGRIQLSAAAASAIVGSVINTTGVLQVGSAVESDGVIVLEASGGNVEVAGDILGGDVTITGDRIHGGGDIDTGGALEINVNAGAIADTTTGGDNWIADALGLIGTVGGGSTVNLGAGVYAAGTNVTASNVTIDGQNAATVVVDGTPLAGLTISGDGVTVQNLAINGPVVGDHRTVDWGAELSTVGIVVNNGAENATITGNEITNIRTGIRLHGGGNPGAEVSDNYIENTKGAILVQYTDGADLDIFGNSQGPLGNEWGVVVNLNTGTPLNQHATTDAQTNIMALSDGNNGMTVMDRAYAWSNRSHVWVDGDSTVTPADDFDYGNGLGNERQALHTVQAGVIAVAAGGTVNVLDGTYVENVLIDKAGISLLSVNGRDATTITGVAGMGRLGAVQVAAGANDFTLGGDGQGFTIIGFDSASAGVENAAVYFQGANSGATISGNRITANGDGGLLTEYGAVVSNLTIDGNIFDGQTFVGSNPAGEGFGQQFSLHNVPRQLVTIGGGNGGGNTSNVAFTNNQVTGAAGGLNGGGQEQGNTLVTIDSVGATITGNTFAGTTTRYGNQLRARGTNTLISGNTFDNTNMGAATSPLYVRNSVFGAGQADFATMIGDNTFIGQGAWADVSDTGFHSFSMSIQGAVNEAGDGATVRVLDGTYNENVLINAANLTLQSVNQHGAVVDAGGTGAGISVSSAHGALGTVTIDGFTVQNWNTGGIVQGMAAAPFATTHVLNNNVIGPVGGSTAHGNGIQVSGDGSTVIGNTVSGAILNSADWTGSGILVVNGSNITVADNQVSGSDAGIAVMNYNNAGGMTGIVIDGNDVSGAIYDAVSIQVYGGPIGSVAITGNTLHDNANGVGVWDYGPGGLPTVTITSNDFADNQSHVASNFAHLTVDGVLGSNTFDRTVHAAGGTTIYGDLSYAVSDATAGSDLLLSGDTFVEDDQILIDRDLTLTGQDGTVVQAGRNFTGSAPANAWWLIEEDVNFSLTGLSIDGSGFSITNALRNHGHTTIDNVSFSNIVHGAYGGVAIGSFGGSVAGGFGAGTWANSSLTVTNSDFNNIGRIAVLVKGTDATADIIGNSFTGKGDGDWLDYAVEVGASGSANILNNTITGNTGVAASDGSTSAGILVTSYYGGASTAFIEGNAITGNTTGIHVGYDGSDVSSVVARSNDLSGNDSGLALTATSATADASGNWFGTDDEAAILAYMGGDEAGSVDFSTYLTSGADADAADGFQGDFSDVGVTALGRQTGAGDRIQEGVDFAAHGGTVNVGAGTFVLNGTLDIGQSVSLIGAGQGLTLFDGSGISGYGMLVEADDVSLSGFTFQGNNSTSSGHYGIKVQPDTGDASDRVHNFSITDVTIQGWGGTELDLNGVVGAMIDGVTADGQGTKGVGIALTDSADVTIVNSTTLNNLWGSVALYQTNRFYDQQVTDIHIDADANSFGEDIGVFAQSYSDIGLEIGDLYLTGFSHIVVNPDHRANGDEFVFFRTSEQDALDFAVNLNPAESDASLVGGWTGSDFNGTFTVGVGNLTGGGTQALSIATAVDAAETGNIVRVLDGTYVLNSTLNIDEGIYLVGNGQTNTFIDASGVSGYGIHVTADGVQLSNFTLDGPSANAGSSYGIKVNPGSSDPGAVIDGFWITDVTVRGSGRTELDLHAVTNAVIDGFTADGQGTSGVGIGITDSANIHIVNSTTLDNAWGGVGLWQRNSVYDQQLTDIVIDGSNSFGEANAVYAQQYHTATAEIGDLWIAGFDYLVFNDQHDAASDYYWFQRTQQDAIDFAVNVNNADASVVSGWDGGDFDGTFVVGVGELLGGGTYAMSIGAAANLAQDGNTIRVLAGTYAAFGTSFGGASDLSILGDTGAIIDGSGGTLTGRIVDLRADSTTFSGFTIQSDGNGVGISISGQGVTASGNTISDVLTGIQTTTQYAAGDAVITGNTISSDYGISLQNTGNTVSGNTVNAAVEGVGLLQGANSFSDNSFTIGTGGDALNLYGTASAADMSGGNNTVTIDGGGLQGAVDLALDDGTVNVGDGTYAEDVLVSGVRTLLFGDVTVDGLTLAAGAAGSGVSGDVTSTGDLAFAGDVSLLGDLDLDAAGDLAMAGVTGPGHDLTLSGASVSLGSANVGGLDITGATTLTGGAYVADHITIAGATTLTQDTILNTSGANGDVSLGSVDGASAGGQDLTVLAGTGDIGLGALGGSTALGAVSLTGGAIQSVGVNAIGSVTFAGLTVSLEGDYATGGGDLTVTGPVTLADDVSADTDGGDAAFGTVNGAWELDIDAGPGTITVAALGGSTALSEVSLTGGAIHTAGATTTGDQSYEAASVTLAGGYATGGGDFAVTGASTLTGATSVVTGGGDLAMGSVNGGHDLTLDAADGDAVLGSMGATTRLGAVSVLADSTVLQGNVYAGSSLAFLGSGTDSTVRLTRTSTTFNSTVSAAGAGDITIAPHLIGTTAGAQSVSFIAGSGTGLASANGDISIGDAGSNGLRLGSMTVRGDDFSAQTVKLAGNYSATLTGNQTFSANTLDTLGNINATVGGNESGPVIAGGSVNLTVGGTSTGSLQAGGSTTVTSGGTQNRIVDAGGPVNLTSGGGIGGSVTTPGAVNLQSTQNVDVQVNAGTVDVNAPGGQISGAFGEITTGSGGTFVVNGETVVGSGDADARQFLTDQFITPAGGVVGSTGQIQLPVGLAIALIAPAGEGEGQRRPIVVNSIERLGELLRLGYTAIIVQINDGSEPEYEQELDIALEGDVEPVA